eukprot:2573916-Rhodomonas_salina.2
MNFFGSTLPYLPPTALPPIALCLSSYNPTALFCPSTASAGRKHSAELGLSEGGRKHSTELELTKLGLITIG